MKGRKSLKLYNYNITHKLIFLVGQDFMSKVEKLKTRNLH